MTGLDILYTSIGSFLTIYGAWAASKDRILPDGVVADKFAEGMVIFVGVSMIIMPYAFEYLAAYQTQGQTCYE